MSVPSPLPPAREQTVLRPLPPVDWIALASMVLVIAGTVVLAAQIPGTPSLLPSVVLLALAAVLAAAAAVVLGRVRDFAARIFFRVGRWVLLGYAVIAGMIELVFLLNDVRGAQLVTMTLLLALFTLDAVFLLAFGVARYQPAD